VQHIAQARLDRDVLPRVKTMVSNSVYVNSAEILYFSRNLYGEACSCHRKTRLYENQSYTDNETLLKNTGNTSLRIKHHGILFGELGYDNHVDHNFPNQETMQDQELLDNVDDTTYLLEDSKDCGVCYRTGVLPPYTLIGATSCTITPSNVSSNNATNIIEYDGYTIDQHQTPERFTKIRDDGYIKLKVLLPPVDMITKFYVSIRNDYKVLLDDFIYVIENNQEVALDKLSLLKKHSYTNSGNTWLECVVKSDSVSHIVFHVFTSDFIRANISEESYNLDYEVVSTTSNITLTISSVLPNVYSGDIVYIPKKNLVLKVTDFKRADTVKRDFWEWTVTCRSLQPQESLSFVPMFNEVFNDLN
jgi:hypothetical protein